VIEIILWVVFAAFVMELIDSTLGGGFGTVLSPILLLAGFEPLLLVPSIILSEIFTGFLSGYLNHTFENVDLINDGPTNSSLKILIVTGAIGAILAAVISINFPSIFVKYYIAILVIVMGILVLLKRNGIGTYKRKRVLGLGLLSGFNKGISGGGYGPIVVSGQVLSGLGSKQSVAVTSIAEAATCIFALLIYILSGNFQIVGLTVSICLGATLATPFSVYIIKRVESRNLLLLVGVGVLIIGIYTLFRLTMG